MPGVLYAMRLAKPFEHNLVHLPSSVSGSDPCGHYGRKQDWGSEHCWEEGVGGGEGAGCNLEDTVPFAPSTPCLSRHCTRQTGWVPIGIPAAL